jgi:ornithine--oxo-acid transaminase
MESEMTVPLRSTNGARSSERAPLDIPSLFAEREAERYSLHTRYLNDQLVRVLQTIGFDVRFRRGEGPYLFDGENNRYLDLMAGWGVFALGRNHPTVRDALKSVLDCDLPNVLHMDVPVLAAVLAERLLKLAPYMEKAFFCNSGTESVEAAVKLSRAATGRPGVVYCSHAFHGLTYGALSVNGDETFRRGFGPLIPDCTRVPFDDLEALEKALSSRQVAAFIVEPIQGKGVHIPSDEYLPAALALCRKYGTIFIADEVQTGLGRTGKFLAVEHWGVEPDMITLAKALSGGHVPVGAVLMRKWIHQKLYCTMERTMVHGSTFGSNNLAMAAGLATLEVLQAEHVIENAARTGERLLRAFQDMASRYELIKAVRGKGLMIGIEFGQPRSFKLRTTWSALEAMSKDLFCQMIIIPLFKQHKILCQVAGNNSHTIKVQPALTIGDSDCEWIEQAFDAVIEDTHRGPAAVWSLGKTLATHAMQNRTA